VLRKRGQCARKRKRAVSIPEQLARRNSIPYARDNKFFSTVVD
jgi:hypothetical protein